jgi:hypothetical protein
MASKSEYLNHLGDILVDIVDNWNEEVEELMGEMIPHTRSMFVNLLSYSLNHTNDVM